MAETIAVEEATIAAAKAEASTHDEHVHAATCPDCHSPALGKFCVECGQEIHVHRSLWHLGHEILHGVMHFDGRFWRTLPLLIARPGKLTRKWCEGKRTRFVSPLAMFLCTLFVMFMALSFAPQPAGEVMSLADQITLQELAVERAKEAVTDAKANAQSAQEASRSADGQPPAVSSGITSGVAEAAVAKAEAGVIAAQARLDRLKQEAVDGREDGLVAGSWQAQVADLNISTGGSDKGLAATVSKKLKNPDLALYKLQQTTYKFAFLLVPLSIPFMALLFLWKRRFTLYDHSVFVIYSLTFMSMLLMVGVVIGTLFPGSTQWVLGTACVIAPLHMFAQIKGAYSLGVWGALWRTIMLTIFCSIVMMIFVVAIIYLGLGH